MASDAKLAPQGTSGADNLPRLAVRSWEDPFDDALERELAALLPDFLLSRRWYRAKARTISQLEIVDIIPVAGTRGSILVIEISYADSGRDTYLLALRASDEIHEADEIVARLQGPDGKEGLLYSALSDPQFRTAVLSTISCDTVHKGRTGELIGSHTSAFPDECGDSAPLLESFVSRAEQSNTSIIYKDRFILKLFRKLESGLNPDIEIGRFLTESGFAGTPSVYGLIEYRSASGETYAAGLLQRFVKNRGDAWKYTLESLEAFFARALATGADAPSLASQHPLQLMSEPLPANAQELLSDYIDSANLLGTRTAEMHAALSSSATLLDFVPEAFGNADCEKLYRDMLEQSGIAFHLLKERAEKLSGPAAEDAGSLLRRQDEINARFTPLRDYAIKTSRIRHHGDYHLGQVLYTGEDFLIIDFEGEPARPLSERRLKTISMRDVAGMIRSFQYAAYAALFGQVPGVPTDPALRPRIESWAAFWTAWVSAVYVKAYFARADNLPFVPQDHQERQVLFDAFLLQKALYEVAYELNNRPDWVRIPLRGILSLVS